MERNVINISVEGISASGKTTIVAIIENALREKGFENIITSGAMVTDGDYEHTQINLHKKIEGIKEFNEEIRIEEVRANR